MRRPLHVRATVLLASAVGAAASSGAGAASWEFAPIIEGGYKYNDNYRLDLPGEEIEVSGAEVDAAFAVRTLDPRLNVELVPRVRATYFLGESAEESTDYFLQGLIEDLTPRRRTGVQAAFSSQDVVRSETPDAEFEGDLGDPQDVGSGRITLRNRRDLVRIAPYFSYDLTQRHGLELRAHYVDAQFDNQQSFQQDFSDAGASAGLAFKFSPRSRITVRALASRYETSFDTDAYGGHAEWATDFSPTSLMYLRVGAQKTEPEDRSSETSVVAGVGGRWTRERNALFLDLTRTVEPISAGTVVERHQLRLRVDHDVSPRLSLLLGMRASRDEDIREAGTYPTREYAAADVGLEWRWLRYVAVTAAYNYRWQEYADEPSDASANGFLIGLVYEPKRRD